MSLAARLARSTAQSTCTRNNSHSDYRRQQPTMSKAPPQKPVNIDEKLVATTSSGGISPTQAYLLLYNLGCALGWNLAISRMGTAFLEGGGVLEAVEASHDVIVILQLLSTLEFVHGCLGCCLSCGAVIVCADPHFEVKSNPVNVFMQVLGRDLALLSVVTSFPPVRDSRWILLMFSAWATCEVIRYPFYALSIAGMCPPALKWLRYTAFIVLYPLGFVGELGTWIVGIPHIKAVGLPALPGLPDGSSIYLLYAYMAFAFGIGAPKLYMHMLRQREKQLQTGKVKAS